MDYAKLVDPILVTGTGRSGTTLTMRLLKAHGVWIGSESDVCENHAIKAACVYGPLEALGYDRYGIAPRPDTPLAPPGFDMRELVTPALRRAGYGSGRWAFKDAKLLLMWPVWHMAFPNAKWVVAMRDAECVLDSYSAFLGHDRDTMREFVADYVRHAFQLVRTVRNAMFVWPEQWVHGDYRSLNGMLEWLGLTPGHYEAIDRELWHYMRPQSA